MKMQNPFIVWLNMLFAALLVAIVYQYMQP